jgi:hypothetical protein
MTSRRNFVKTSAVVGAGLMVAGTGCAIGGAGAKKFISQRPEPGKRKFVSDAVEKTIAEVKAAIKDPELGWLFENCFPNTLDTTVNYSEVDGKPDTFVITGDIDAMWLRDSSAQVWPYLPLVANDQKLKLMINGLINRQAKCVLHDPYANAFLPKDEESEWKTDLTDMKPGIHERKWEIDSLCYPIRLSYNFWKISGDTSSFDEQWVSAMKLIVKTFKEQQRKDGPGPYKFMRQTAIATDTCPGRGLGNPAKPVGLICSNFRPSDDATIFLYLVPSNYFAVVSLRQLAEMSRSILNDETFATECIALADEVESALKKYAVQQHPEAGEILAFEVDGFGNRLFMDDSNVPSLLSLPYLGAFDVNDPLYQATRKFVLSENNPYFFKGKAAEGIGGPHVGMNYIWPMSITMRIFTSTDEEEIKTALNMLKSTHAGTGFMHEGFNKDNPDDFTRKWFAWSNTLFGEMILKLYHEKPHLLKA